MIRPATLRDVPALVTLGGTFLASSIYGAHFTDQPDVMAALITHLITVPDGIVFVGDVDGQVVGAIGLLCAPHVWTGDRSCGECFWFVAPDARGSIGIRLLHAAEAWARSQDATSMQMVSPTGEERVATIYQHAGYVPLETGWVKALTTRDEATPWAI
jgi:GNAT superfamily N-acetyltransferase